MNVILFGPPGAGKGTQAQLIVKKHNYFQLSTGDLLRHETKKNSELGKKIEQLISKGKFVPNEIVNLLLKNTIDNLKFRDRIIFDGYPRTIEQAIESINTKITNIQRLQDSVTSKSAIRKQFLLMGIKHG